MWQTYQRGYSILCLRNNTSGTQILCISTGCERRWFGSQRRPHMRRNRATFGRDNTTRAQHVLCHFHRAPLPIPQRYCAPFVVPVTTVSMTSPFLECSFACSVSQAWPAFWNCLLCCHSSGTLICCSGLGKGSGGLTQSALCSALRTNSTTTQLSFCCDSTFSKRFGKDLGAMVP